DSFYWVLEGRNTLKSKIKYFKKSLPMSYLEKKAKNVIFFLGDGMGLSTITAARIYKGNKDGISEPEDGFLAFEKFPFTSLVKVNAMDTLVADSASTSTSYLRGVKANYQTIGVTARVKYSDCETSLIDRNRVSSIFDWAQTEGKLTGFVTTTRITHATPAGLYAYSANRDWEHFAPDNCSDIAAQLVYGKTGQNIRVAFGGGRREFLPNNCGFRCEKGLRNDTKNLISEWLSDKKKREFEAHYVTTRQEMYNLDDNSTDFVLGLFADDHMNYELKRPPNQPNLSEMTLKAMKILQAKSSNGFVLFVEGGRIDHAHHSNLGKFALEETYQFNKAIESTLHETNLDETLVIVTADHSHSFTINGYSKRGGNILGKADVSKKNHTILLYANGPGLRNKVTNIFDDNYAQKSAVYLSSAAHAGEDIPVYAVGPGAFLFSGVTDQTFIPHAISYAA
ncbi:alkaline phosphatase-like protein, partial [Dinothrombium tinctorium]